MASPLHKTPRSPVSREREPVTVTSGSVLLVPQQSVDFNTRLDNFEDDSTVYSDEPRLAFDEKVAEQPRISESELDRILLEYGLDRDGLPLRGDLIYSFFNRAADFVDHEDSINCGKRPTDALRLGIPHIVLWDYFGGNSCLDVNVLGGTEVAVLAEEYQVRKVSGLLKSGKFLRLPRKWSLVRITGQKHSRIGLIPSCYVVKKKVYDANLNFFKTPSWYIGKTDIVTAYEALMENRFAYHPGLFVIFSPVWLNINYKDYRPFILLVMCKKSGALIKNMVRFISQKKATRSKVPAKIPTQNNVKKPPVAEGDSPVEEDEPAFPSTQEWISQMVTSSYYIKTYTIRRSSIGRYLLFDMQFESLYDLVAHFSNYASALPHLLDSGPTECKGIGPSAIPPPCKQPKRDPFACTMRCEQVAAKHFDQVTEPSLLRPVVSFVHRSVLDPRKADHKKFIKTAKLKDTEVQAAEKWIKANVDRIPDDESVIRAELIDTSRVSVMESPIDCGAFAAVYKGSFKLPDGSEVPVAVKQLRLIAPRLDIRQAWISEVEILSLVYHPNVCRFFGFSYGNEMKDVHLVFELATHGNLAHYVQRPQYTPSVNEAVDFGVQIGRGMSYLHSFEPAIVHGDLAARNVLLCVHPMDPTRFVCKVTDFGLSKTCLHDSHFLPDDPDKIPYKWLPPEVLSKRELNYKCDIWSFGVLLTELFTTKEPYGLVEPKRVLDVCRDGHRIQRPSAMPHYIYTVVLKCWRFQPQDRPSMEDVVRMLEPYYIESEMVASAPAAY